MNGGHSRLKCVTIRVSFARQCVNLLYMVKRFQSPNLRRVWVGKGDTTINVEPEFWDQFKLIALEHRATISALLAEIDRTMRLLPYQGPGRHRVRTLSAAVRVFVLQTLISRSSSGARGARVRSPRSPWSLPRGMHSS